MKKFIVFGLLFFVVTVYANDPNQIVLLQTAQDVSQSITTDETISVIKRGETGQLEKYKSLDNKVLALEESINQTKKEFDKKLDYQIKCNEKAINSVNTSISGASCALSFWGNLITVVGIVVGILAIGLGIYITRQVEKVKSIAEESRVIFDRHLKIRNEVRYLDKNIKSNMKGLYSDLKTEETRALVERLVEVPEDVENLSESLLSREISGELFPKIKKAYQFLSETDTVMLAGCKQKYRILLFQHFSGQSLFDRDLEDEMENDYPTLMDCSFSNDIIKASGDFIAVTIEKGDIFKYSEKIKKFCAGIQQSRYKDDLKLFKHIYNILRTKENRFNFYSIVQQGKGALVVVNKFSEFLMADYKDSPGNTVTENEILTGITETIESEKEK